MNRNKICEWSPRDAYVSDVSSWFARGTNVAAYRAATLWRRRDMLGNRQGFDRRIRSAVTRKCVAGHLLYTTPEKR
jgi:hypothetical protein